MIYPLQFFTVSKLSMGVGHVENHRVETPNGKGQGDKHKINHQNV